jgi:hypothetical protein
VAVTLHRALQGICFGFVKTCQRLCFDDDLALVDCAAPATHHATVHDQYVTAQRGLYRGPVWQQ